MFSLARYIHPHCPGVPGKRKRRGVLKALPSGGQTRRSSMEGKQRDDRQGFQGVFTPGVRRRMKSRRKALGLSVQKLGEAMGVNWSTLRKWEDGSVGCCRPAHARKLSRFLSGELDGAISLMSSTPLSRNEERRGQNQPLWECMERLSGLYRICQGNPEWESAMVTRVNEALRRSAERLRKYAGTPQDKEEEE